MEPTGKNVGAGTLLAAVLCVASAACGSAVIVEADDPNRIRPTIVSVSPDMVEMTALGETVQLTAKVFFDQHGNVIAASAVVWASSNTA